MEVHDRQIANRKKVQVMDRRWIQAVFKRSDCEGVKSLDFELVWMITVFSPSRVGVSAQTSPNRDQCWMPLSCDSQEQLVG